MTIVLGLGLRTRQVNRFGGNSSKWWVMILLLNMISHTATTVHILEEMNWNFTYSKETFSSYPHINPHPVDGRLLTKDTETDPRKQNMTEMSDLLTQQLGISDSSLETLQGDKFSTQQYPKPLLLGISVRSNVDFYQTTCIGRLKNLSIWHKVQLLKLRRVKLDEMVLVLKVFVQIRVDRNIADSSDLIEVSWIHQLVKTILIKPTRGRYRL